MDRPIGNPFVSVGGVWKGRSIIVDDDSVGRALFRNVACLRDEGLVPNSLPRAPAHSGRRLDGRDGKRKIAHARKAVGW